MDKGRALFGLSGSEKLNLLVNGCEAMTDTVAAERRFHIRSTSGGADVRISVGDQGCGIAGGDTEKSSRRLRPPKHKAWAWAWLFAAASLPHTAAGSGPRTAAIEAQYFISRFRQWPLPTPDSFANAP